MSTTHSPLSVTGKTNPDDPTDEEMMELERLGAIDINGVEDIAAEVSVA
jgi:hypothetical protein